jgi:pyruvate formate lyase activating enzyme
VPRNYVAALQCDPVEKKPFFHVLPGARALTFGMLGCDFHCGYCQNWITSQALRDERASLDAQEITAPDLVQEAVRSGAGLVVSSYNEPLITAEWAAEVFDLARPRGLLTGFVSNGNATPEALDFLRPRTDCYKIDLKTMNDRRYRQLGGVLQHVLDAIRLVHERGFWLEVVTLVVPGFSSDEGELRAAAEYLAGIDRSVPWHLTAFHEDYKMHGTGHTPGSQLLRACEIGAEAGLHFVYAGNLPGRVGGWEDTRCPGCHSPVIERSGYRILANRLGPSGECPRCGYRVPGIWNVER